MGEWRLGSYELLRRLGEGGMAQVYLARDVRLGREVAVKVLDRRLAERPGFRERFMREARVAAALDHPNIVPLFDFGDTEALYLVMPFVSGGSLQDVLPRAPLPIGEVVTYGSQIADALEYAHQRKVVHRDVKPANMLVHADGRLMLSDFGLAKIVNATHKLETPRNRPDAGTPEYMAPEQVVGSSDARSDIYGLGVVLYLLLTGRLPFSGSSSHEVMQAHLYKEPAPVRRYNVAVPAAMEAVVMRAMAKQPGERFQRASELGAALLSALIADAGDAPAFVINSPSRDGSRPTGQTPAIAPAQRASDLQGEPPPWMQRQASGSQANTQFRGVSGHVTDASADRSAPASSNWESARSGSPLTGILPDLNMPFTSLDAAPGMSSADNQVSGVGMGAPLGPSDYSAPSARSGFSGLGTAGSRSSSMGGGSGFADSHVIGGFSGVAGGAQTLGRMPAVEPPVPPPYTPLAFPAAPTDADYARFDAQQMQQVQRQLRYPATQMEQRAPVAPTYGAPITPDASTPHAQRADLRATLPGSRMTEPPPVTELRERRSFLWVIIAILLIILVIAVVILLRWLEAGAAGFMLFPVS